MQALITPENFYGLPQLPFNIHLGMEFERPSPDGGALLRLPAAALTHDVGGSVHRGAMYTLGEVAAAVCVLDSLVDALPVFLLTLNGEFRKVADPVGSVWTEARPSAGNGPVDEVRSRRKMNVTGEVSIYDEQDRLVAEMSATFLARVLSNTMATALLAEAG
jgi:acyl-coenzyme A thioesterase PaaI-like protein